MCTGREVCCWVEELQWSPFFRICQLQLGVNLTMCSSGFYDGLLGAQEEYKMMVLSWLFGGVQ